MGLEQEARVLGPDGKPVRQFTLHRTQREVISHPARFKVLPAGRRWGKSECAVLWCLMKGQGYRIRNEQAVIWIVFPTYRVAATAWRKFIRLSPRGWITATVGTDLSPIAIRMGSVTYEFRSAEHPEKLVGEGLHALWMDECGTIKEAVWKESLRPTLMDVKAPALFTGTPKGHNWFWDLFQQGQDPLFPETKSFSSSANAGMPSYQNPFIDPSEIATLANELTERQYKQEILAEFLSDDGAVFKDIRSHVRPIGNMEETVAIGVDLARRHDFTVIIGLNKRGRVTYFDRFNQIDWPFQRLRIKAAWERLGRPVCVMDSTGVGDPFVQFIRPDLGMRLVPFEFTGKSKMPLVEALVIAWEEKGMDGEPFVTVPDEPVLLNELQTFDARQMPSGYTRYEASEGKHDDCVMALALAWVGARRYGDLGVTF